MNDDEFDDYLTRTLEPVARQPVQSPSVAGTVLARIAQQEAVPWQTAQYEHTHKQVRLRRWILAAAILVGALIGGPNLLFLVDLVGAQVSSITAYLMAESHTLSVPTTAVSGSALVLGMLVLLTAFSFVALGYDE